MGVLLAVPGGVGGGVAQAEVGTEVDHVAHPPQQVSHQAAAGPVGQGAEDHVEAVDHGRVDGAEAQVPVGGRQPGGDVGHEVPGVRVGPDVRHLQRRVGGEQPQQLHAGVARRSQDPDSQGHARILPSSMHAPAS